MLTKEERIKSLKQILKDARGRTWITGREPKKYGSTICIRIDEADRRILLSLFKLLEEK